MALYTTDLLILGSGPAGYTAGIYAARAGLKTMIVSGNQEGGQLTMTSSIENFPGFEEISGFELMDKMKQQALKLGVQFANDNIVEVDFGNRPFVCSSENGHSYKARAVIVRRFLLSGTDSCGYRRRQFRRFGSFISGDFGR